MPRYARLRESELDQIESEFFEVGGLGTNFSRAGEKTPDGELLVGGIEAERAQQKSIRDHIYTVPSTELLSSSAKVQYSKAGYANSNSRGQLQQQQQQQQNIENGNPNVCASDPASTQSTVVAISSHSSTASGASLQEQGGGSVKAGASLSGRSIGSSFEDRSGRWKAAGCESFRLVDDTSSGVQVDATNATELQQQPGPPPCGQRTGISQRTRPNPEHHRAQESESSARAAAKAEHLPVENGDQPCPVHSSSCTNARHCEKFAQNPLPLEEGSRFPITEPEKKSSSATPHSNKGDGICGVCSSQESGWTVRRSNSTRDVAGSRSQMSIENWGQHSASRSAHYQSDGHRVSFSLAETHDLEHQKKGEKWREPTSHIKKFWTSKKQPDQHLRYNYEQPGFVEREKDSSGKAYTIYGVKDTKDCPRGSSGRHQQQLVRAFSLREQSNNYMKISRAYSVNASGRNVVPVECEECGKGGLGIVILGFSGNEGSFCKTCKSSAENGWDSADKSSKKKKGIFAYCRKLLRLPKKVK